MFRFSLLTVAALIIAGLMGTNEAQAAVTGYNVMYRNAPSANWTVYTQAGNQAVANATAAQLMQQGFLTQVVPVGIASSVPVATGGTYYAAPGDRWRLLRQPRLLGTPRLCRQLLGPRRLQPPQRVLSPQHQQQRGAPQRGPQQRGPQ